jgi:hypothetical protein
MDHNPVVGDDFFTAHRQNLTAIESALDALAAMRPEFEQQGSASEHWFYDLTCAVVHRNYLLHCLIADLETAATPWRGRLGIRLLATHALETLEEVGGALNRTLEKRVAEITDNPRITGPLEEAAKDFATFRRVNDKAIRALKRDLGLEPGRGGERHGLDRDLDQQTVIGLAMGVIAWLSAFGRAATLLISVIRGEKAARRPPDGQATG